MSQVKETCLRTPDADILDAIKTTVEEGCEIITDGVGETTVREIRASCEDIGSVHLCSLVGTGILSCERDFCPSPSCGHASECDRTCGYCSEQAKGRRLQITIGDFGCNPEELRAKTDEVNDACCDPGSGLCADGVPTSCDVSNALY